MITKQHPPTNRPSQPRGLSRQWLMLALIGLMTVTVYRFYNQRQDYQVRLFTTSIGWGYSVLANGNELIYQPTIPGQTGQQGFATQAQAQQVGELVCQKLKTGQQSPAIGTDELRRLGIAVHP